MENAVKALIMAAGVLIGIMIISIGTSLYSSLSEFVEESQESRNSLKIQQFNEQFTKYINCDKHGNIEFTLTIQDVITAANAAYDNNEKTDYYVTIKLDGLSIEKNISVTSAGILKTNLDAKFKCTRNNVKFDNTTGRVCEVNFLLAT